MPSEIIEDLLKSSDPLERELGQALLNWQDHKASQGLQRSLGYEPREIREKGAIAVIEARVMNGSSGFGEIDKDSSYEAIVDRHPHRFREEAVSAARRRLQLGQSGYAGITSKDVHLIASSRSKQRYTDLSDEENEAYVRASASLQHLGDLLKSKLTKPDKFEVRTTSGFNIKSGIRSYIPKDLWFSVSPRANSQNLAGMPQLFMIVSERGIEYGYGASVSPSDFSQQSVKRIERKAAPIVFEQLPSPGSPESTGLQHGLEKGDTWYFRRKHRLSPNQQDFASFQEWLHYLQSPDGKKHAAGAISRYVLPDDVDDVGLEHEVSEMARLFEPLLDRQWHTGEVGEIPTPRPAQNMPPQEESNLESSNEFAARFTRFLNSYGDRRSGTFGVDEELRVAMHNLKSWLEEVPAIAGRPTINVEIGVGKGGWTKTPWIALLDNRVTTTTQRGTYVVFLIAEDLAITHLTLNQGMTELKNRLGQRGAQEEMVRVAKAVRPLCSELEDAGFKLDNDIDLRSATSAAKNYEIGTIAHVPLSSDDLPDDSKLQSYLHALLEAHERVIETRHDEPEKEPEDTNELRAEFHVEPYGIDNALAELFLSREDVERQLETWRNKKNLILTGAPGVGKSFIARRLAYTLIGFRDDRKVQTIQFHQSYSYEDFVQGYRPNGNQGFERKNGTFYEFRDRALKDPDGTYVFIIDEINRGNLSKIFGELMLLIEADKRGPTWKTRLAYSADGDDDFYVPDNLFILGMMNTADRSLSLVDYALRRRFAFVAMEPLYGADKFRAHLEAHGIPEDVINRVVKGMGDLNQAIETDRTNLGPGFRIGHSFFTPTEAIADSESWYRRIVETEIYPLLEEYWFDDPEKAGQWRDQLLG